MDMTKRLSAMQLPSFDVEGSYPGSVCKMCREADVRLLEHNFVRAIGILRNYVNRTRGRNLPQDVHAENFLRELGEE